MTIRYLFILVGLTIVGALLLVIGWEFVAGEMVVHFVFGKASNESPPNKWEHVLTAVGIFGIALFILTMVASKIITKRKHIEKSLRKSEKALRDQSRRMEVCLDTAAIGTWEWNIQDDTHRWDARLKAMFGIPAEKFEGFMAEDFINALHPDDAQVATAAINQTIEGKKNYDVDFRVVWPDGSVHWMNSRAELIRDDAGKPLKMFGATVDITERKRSEEKYQALFDQATEGIVIRDPETYEIYDCNQIFAKRLGYERAELIGDNINKFSHAPVAPGRDQRVSRLNSDENDVVERVLCRKDGTEFPVEVSSNNLLYGGRNVVLSFVRDLTERNQSESALRESEEYFRRIFEDAQVGMTEVALDGHIRRANKAFCRMIGYSQEELLGLTVHDITHPDYVAETEEDRSILISGITENNSIEKKHIRKDGTILWSLVTRSLITDEHGKPLYTIGQIQDITAAKQQEDQLRQSQKMEAVGQLTGGIAHDFNNLLAGIQGNLSIIKDPDTSEEERLQRLERAEAIVQRGADLTKHMLAFSRKQTLAPKSTDMGNLIGQMLDLMRRTLGETILIGFEFAPGLWPAMVDPHQLENAILNLAINARDAMRTGGALSVHGHNFQVLDGQRDNPFNMPVGDYVAISVHDTGHGIPGDQLDKVFDPFFTTKDVGAGSGLGLSMVYGFAKQSGGYAVIDSTEGVSTKVTLYLPRAAAHETGDDDIAAEPISVNGAGERIMVIEDDADVRDVTTVALAQLGYEVIDGGDGADAVKIGYDLDASIDLLLTDVVLPHGNSGPDLAEALSRKWQQMKVLMMTGYAENDFLRTTDDAPIHPLIQKPFRTSDLSRQIKDVLADR